VTRRKPVLRRLRDLLFVNSSRVHLARANAAFARGVEPGMRVLDAGAGDAPYQHMFAHAHYESADFEKVAKSYGETTYVCSLDAIPVEDNRFAGADNGSQRTPSCPQARGPDDLLGSVVLRGARAAI
jgi:hypothetical protein